MLESAGLELFANPRIPEGEAYVVEKSDGRDGWL